MLDAVAFAALAGPLALPVALANICSYSMGIAASFVLNGAWTFGSFADRPAAMRQAGRFAATNAAGLALSTVVVTGLAQVLPEMAAKIASVPIVFMWNYASSRLWVFR